MKILKTSAILVFGLLLLLATTNCKRQTGDIVDCAFSGLKADFDYAYNGTDAPAEVSFTNKSEQATSYEWDFGDNAGTSNATNPKYIYQMSGTYTVTLKAILKLSNGDECFQFKRTDITIN